MNLLTIHMVNGQVGQIGPHVLENVAMVISNFRKKKLL